mgnify:CR=1 FL=1
MAHLFNFALVRITEGKNKGRMGRIYSYCDKITKVVGDYGLGRLNIWILDCPSDAIDVYHVYPVGAVEFMEMSQPSDEFMTGNADRLREIINEEMKKCLEKELILERISTLGELSDLVVLQNMGWQAAFWERYVRIFGPKYKKRPKNARKVC